MIVKELVEVLQRCNPDMIVAYHDPEYDDVEVVNLVEERGMVVGSVGFVYKEKGKRKPIPQNYLLIGGAE